MQTLQIAQTTACELASGVAQVYRSDTDARSPNAARMWERLQCHFLLLLSRTPRRRAVARCSGRIGVRDCPILVRRASPSAIRTRSARAGEWREGQVDTAFHETVRRRLGDSRRPEERSIHGARLITPASTRTRSRRHSSRISGPRRSSSRRDRTCSGKPQAVGNMGLSQRPRPGHRGSTGRIEERRWKPRTAYRALKEGSSCVSFPVLLPLVQRRDADRPAGAD